MLLFKFRELQTRAHSFEPITDERSKRDLLDAIENIGEVVIGSSISNLVMSVSNTLNPHSDHNKLNTLKEHVEDQDKRIREFEFKFNLSAEIHKGLFDTMSALNHRLTEVNRQLMHVAHLMPKVSWTSSYIQSRIYTAAQDMKNIVNQFIRGHVATEELSELLNIPQLYDVDPEDAHFITAVNINLNTIFLRFYTKVRSADTHVYKVDAFNYWENLIQTPVRMECRGYKHLIYNESNNCLKAIEEPSTLAITQTCLNPNSTDPRLQIWKEVPTTGNIYATTDTCQVKATANYHYIYCFPFDIITK